MPQDALFDLRQPNDELKPGKTLASLRQSRQQREDIIRYFGGVLPMSIMAAEKQARKTDLATGSYRKSSNVVDDGSRLSTIFDVSGQSTRSGALSMFPQNIGRIVLRLYSSPRDMVIDPFAGHNSRMELCVSEGRHYHGCDISQTFMQKNEELANDFRRKYPCKIELFCCDSRKMPHTADAYGDFTLTSPPYFDIEDYGDEPEQLGKQPTYHEFLSGLGEVAKQNYRCLKLGAYCVWFVNDFRRRGQFHLYHADVASLLSTVGFTMQDILIVDLGYPIRAAFAQQIIDTRILPKRHEYGLVFRKE